MTQPLKSEQEALVVVNGVELNDEQSKTLRIALTGFLMDLQNPKIFADFGEAGPGYKDRVQEIFKVMFIRRGRVLK